MEQLTSGIAIGWVTLHVAALVAAAATRVVQGSRFEFPSQIAFFAAMAAVSFTISLCHLVDDRSWMMSAVTLMAMVVIAVVDLRRSGDAFQAPGILGSR